ncbi:MAG: hypothetical protein ACRDCD_00485 [Mycoplasmoidaceae bacterium]
MLSKNKFFNRFFFISLFGFIFLTTTIIISVTLNNWSYLASFVLCFPFSLMNFFLLDLILKNSKKNKINNKPYFIFILVFKNLLLLIPILILMGLSMSHNINEIFNVWIILLVLLSVPFFNLIFRSIFNIIENKRVSYV